MTSPPLMTTTTFARSDYLGEVDGRHAVDFVLVDYKRNESPYAIGLLPLVRL